VGDSRWRWSLMSLEKKPFQLYAERTQDLKSIKYPIHLNQEDIINLQDMGVLMQEEKMGTVIKNLMNISITMLKTDPVLRLSWELAFKKKLNNERLGIVEANVDFQQKYHKNF